jgi:uncharacterized protein
VILVDSNVFMYAAGVEHPHKAPSLAVVEGIAAGEVEAAVDADVLQEILHRYRAIGRWDDGQRVYDLVRKIVPEVIPITADDTDAARELMEAHGGLSARDALHAAVCLTRGEGLMCSYDRDFDGIGGLTRIEPGDAGRQA